MLCSFSVGDRLYIVDLNAYKVIEISGLMNEVLQLRHSLTDEQVLEASILSLMNAEFDVILLFSLSEMEFLPLLVIPGYPVRDLDQTTERRGRR